MPFYNFFQHISHRILLSLCLYGSLNLLFSSSLHAQPTESVYGDRVKVDVKLHYVYTLEDALREAKATGKPIFFNCFADWAVPCHGMNFHVFSNQEFGDYMNHTFVNLFIDVSKRENRAIAQQFNIKKFAHFLVLDANANILLRIIGGKKLPEFKEDILRALSEKTSLRGTTTAYNSGKRDKKTLLNYLIALNLADDQEKYAEVATQYLRLLSPKDYVKSENWAPFISQIKDTKSEQYAFLLENKESFIKNNGSERVNNFIESLLLSDIVAQAYGEQPYDDNRLTELYLQLQRAQLPDSAQSYHYYNLAKLRGEHRYTELISYLRIHGSRLGTQQTAYDLSLNLPEMSKEERQIILTYLRERVAQIEGSTAKHYRNLLAILEGEQGIIFENLSFKDALAKAKAEGKDVFIDCYTTWCGPCRILATKVFPLPEVGKEVNARYIPLKIDMEKGEGPELGKRYNVKAYPTMLLLDSDGNLIHSIVGAVQAERLIEEVTASYPRIICAEPTSTK